MSTARRALLFIPATAERFLAKAHERGADAIILDLEDSIPAGEKDQARHALNAAIHMLAGRGVETWVRVNNDPAHLSADLAAATLPGVSGVMLPKVESIDVLDAVDRSLAQLEQTRGLSNRHIQLCATLETPQGILAAPIVATGPRLNALAFGIEDLSAAMHVRPTSAFARGPAQMVALAAAAAGLESWGLAGSIAEFSRPAAFARSVALSKALGLTTILCVHPRQVEIAVHAFRPAADEIAWATEVIEAYDAAKRKGLGSINLNGRMVDEPIYRRARSILGRSPVGAAS